MNAILFLTIFAAQDPNAAFTVGTATAARGQTAYGQIVVPAGVDSGLKIPVAVIHGAKPGKVVAFVAVQRLIPRIPAARLSGTVIVVPLINIGSIEQMTPHLNPVDRKSLNGN